MGYKIPRWKVRIVAFHDDKIVMVQGTNRHMPKRWYLPTGVDKDNEETAEVTAKRVFYRMSGIRVRAGQFKNIPDTKSNTLLLSLAISDTQILWLGSQMVGVTAQLHTRERILAHCSEYGVRTIKLLRSLDFLPPYTPKKPQKHAHEAPLGVCQGGHVGAVGSVCTEASCGGAPYRG